MAKTRYIKEGFFMNEDLADCSPYTRLLFAGLWLLADREGRLEDRPRRIKAELFPYNDVIVDDLLTELAAFNFILRYEVDGTKYIQITNFARHQRIHPHEAASQIPAPPDQISTSDIKGENTEETEESAPSNDMSLDVITLNEMSPFNLNHNVYVDDDVEGDGRDAPTVNVLLQAFSDVCKRDLERLNESQTRKMGQALDDLRALTKQPDEILAPRVRRFGEWFKTRGFTDPTPSFTQVVNDWRKFEAAETEQKPKKREPTVTPERREDFKQFKAKLNSKQESKPQLQAVNR